MSAVENWATGDALGIPVPAHAGALLDAGTAYLTRAMRAAGVLGDQAEVAQICDYEECEGGSTGRKLRLRVTYQDAGVQLPEKLFVKFSRDPDDPIRDRARIQMASEVKIALLSRLNCFPVAVPQCMFADFEEATGTGILITEEIAFGERGIEPHREKCLDSDLRDPLAHYLALMRANGRLAGVHRGGGFPAEVVASLASDNGSLAVSDRPPYSAEQLARRIERLKEFAETYPRLLPDSIRSPDFLDRFAQKAPRYCGHEAAIAQYLEQNVRYNALSHWNANIDNAWFWRDGNGELQCGLMDWGNSRAMNVGVAIAGSLMAADPDFLTENLDTLLARYIEAFAAKCSQALDLDELKDQMFLHIATSGLLWLIDAPAMILRNCANLAEIESRLDPRFRSNELLRNQLHMLTVFLHLWQRFDFGEVLARFLADRR
jgi:hypothetical protein